LIALVLISLNLFNAQFLIYVNLNLRIDFSILIAAFISFTYYDSSYGFSSSTYFFGSLAPLAGAPFLS
jgi:hypothetical protein